jgi:hypothetical protein
VGPAIVEGTALAQNPEAQKELADAIAATSVDPRVWTGAFATNVWGGRFAIDGVLGEGAQGTTFTGTDLKTGARVAVKVFDLGRAKDWKAQELFDREVQTLKSVEHPGIPKLLDVIVDADTGARALVRTMIPGDSLAQVVKRDGPLNEAALWSVLVDAGDVLGALHGRASPIVHRDIKPQNLIKRPDGKVCLVDFGGVGRMREQAGSTVVGTFGYMAPEQLYGAQTPATDMYALGATILALATAREPEDLPRDGLKLDVDKAAPNLSEKLRTLLKKLTAPDPKDRPVDARGLLVELQQIARQKDPVVEPVVDPLEPWPREPRPVDPYGNDGPDLLVGIVSLVFGVLGVAGAVIVGQVILPLVLSVLAAMTSNPAQRERLLQARERVREAAQMAKGSFEGSALHGAQRLEEVSQRDKVRRQLRREERRAMKQRIRDEERRLREVAKQARKDARRARREGKFWT